MAMENHPSVGFLGHKTPNNDAEYTCVVSSALGGPSKIPPCCRMSVPSLQRRAFRSVIDKWHIFWVGCVVQQGVDDSTTRILFDCPITKLYRSFPPTFHPAQQWTDVEVIDLQGCSRGAIKGRKPNTVRIHLYHLLDIFPFISLCRMKIMAGDIFTRCAVFSSRNDIIWMVGTPLRISCSMR